MLPTVTRIDYSLSSCESALCGLGDANMEATVSISDGETTLLKQLHEKGVFVPYHQNLKRQFRQQKTGGKQSGVPNHHGFKS